MDLGLEIQKTNVRIRMIILEILLYVCQFSGKMDNFDFFGQNLPKNVFWIQNFKNLTVDLETAPPDTMCPNFQAKQTTLNFSI